MSAPCSKRASALSGWGTGASSSKICSAIHPRCTSPVCDQAPSRLGLTGNPHDTQSRYIKAAVPGIVAGIYLPIDNPQPGP
jgi:hypothetical protein